MRISRWYGLLATVVLASVVALPAVASALLTNEYGQSFAGTAVCVSCHGLSTGTDYNGTSHGEFARTGTAMSPASDSDMWPVGLATKGDVVTSENVFALGAGTGLYEYIKFDASKATTTGVPFVVLTAEWDPSEPTLWEMDNTAGVEFENYACNQCHMLGATKKGVTVNGVLGTANVWAKEAAADPAVFASWIPGVGIQCERCHGTGVAAASVTQGGHFTSGVKIVGYTEGSVASRNLLKSEVCGQCHGSFKTGGNIAGYTPDKNINDFVPNPYTLADVPTEFSASSKFFPSGQNKGNKHVYYTEWALSGHSIRGGLTATSTGEVTPYQASGASHYAANNANGTPNAGRLLCNRCHTGEGYLQRKGAKIMDSWDAATDPAGMIGQECAACHISHGAETAPGEAVGMAVRAPETDLAAGYSVNASTGPNKSICEDCHNWQREVANAGTAPALPGILAKYVSHPQREIYHGRAMLEIPAGSDFMPGAKCEQCHMPATRSDFPAKTDLPRYADRSWKRYSHRMFIMRPGDAEAWGLAPWGDSCSPCHAGETQGELEANIVAWQADAADLADEASTTIAARVAAGKAVAAGDIDLLKRASANLSLFVQDGSAGAHNPTYEQAGLSKAVELAKSAGGTLSINAPASVGGMQLFGIAGQALMGDGTAAAGVTVTLWSGSTKLGTSVADENGNYAFAQAMSATKAFTVKWARSSQAVSDLTASATVAVQTIPTTLTMTLSATTVNAGVPFTLTGKLTPGSVATILVQHRFPGSTTWVTFKTVTTNAAGNFSVTTRTSVKGTHQYRAFFAGNATYAYDYSQVAGRKLVVR